MEQPRYLKLYKPLGMTPFQLLEQLKKDQPALASQKLAFAGRLDPMAEGEMIVLVGDECKNRKQYERLDKEYEFEVLFGVSTDTYDILGKITESVSSIPLPLESDLEKRINEIIPSFIGKQQQSYPPYSSPRIKGKSLWWWAKEGKLSEIDVPKKEIEIYDLKLLNVELKNLTDLYSKIRARINLVKGNFRQTEIKKLWESYYYQNSQKKMSVCIFRLFCSSGTYVRSITHLIGIILKCPTLTISIKRTKI